MTYSAVGLAAIGVLAGLALRWKVLLPIIVLLPFAAIIFAVSRGLNHGDIVIAVIAGEAILQASYFAGLLIRHGSAAIMRSAGALGFFKNRLDAKARGNDQRTAPPAEAGKGP